ncbi:hypothetical protein Plhal304r1_c018g0065851 [Plasmopara halstedii]
MSPLLSEEMIKLALVWSAMEILMILAHTQPNLLSVALSLLDPIGAYRRPRDIRLQLAALLHTPTASGW